MSKITNKQKSRKKRECFHVVIYQIHQCYGGPEEGGWYYDWWSPHSHLISTHNINKALKYHTMAIEIAEEKSHGKYWDRGELFTAWFETKLWMNATKYRPRYE